MQSPIGVLDRETRTARRITVELCYPPAALVLFCLALMAVNAVAVLKGALRATHGVKEADVVSEY